MKTMRKRTRKEMADNEGSLRIKGVLPSAAGLPRFISNNINLKEGAL